MIALKVDYQVRILLRRKFNQFHFIAFSVPSGNFLKKKYFVKQKAIYFNIFSFSPSLGREEKPLYLKINYIKEVFKHNLGVCISLYSKLIKSLHFVLCFLIPALETPPFIFLNSLEFCLNKDVYVLIKKSTCFHPQ